MIVTTIKDISKMQSELIVRKSIRLKADSAKVWEALTNPELTKQYMFGCEALSDWKPGSTLLWKGQVKGEDKIFVKGNIVSIEPRKKLQYTTFGPDSGLKDEPSNYLTVTLELTPKGSETELVVTQGDFSTVENGEERYKHSLGNWDYTLDGLKKVVEGLS
jgi:uncharacterized protein YndB with AHSA1/START domain